jgi:maltooligosyltrehalose trehalohydrolase
MSRGDFGAIFVEKDKVAFRFWAPDCAEVDLILNDAPVKMSKGEDGVFETIVECRSGAKYCYSLDGKLSVPDPASRGQADDVHGLSVVTAQDYSWSDHDWHGRPWHETVIYELHPGCFGGFKGIKSQLPRLKVLGVTAIELMPIADFPGKHNWGYDGVLPYAPDTAYGTPNDLKDLIDYAHQLNLQIFLDVVYNHFGPDGNYLSSYAADFFREDVHTPWGNAIDFRRDQVRRFFIENALYWLTDYRFDGLRFDAVHAIVDDTFLLEMAAEIRSKTVGRHIHLVLENERNDAALLNSNSKDQKFDAQWTDDWHHCLHVLLTGESEGYYGDFQNPVQQLARCLKEGFAFQGEPSPHANGEPRGTPSAHLPTTAFVICLQNHDQVGNRALGERLTTLAKPEALRAATSLLLLTPQIPMLFMGEEWGETNPFLFFTDHHDELADAVRKGRRKEFAKFRAFSDPETREKIPDPNDQSTFAASIAESPEISNPQQARILDFYHKLLEIRAKYISPYLVGAQSLSAEAIGDAAVRASWRLGNGNVLTLGVNFGNAAVTIAKGAGQVIFCSVNDAEPGMLPVFTTIAWLEEV